MRRRWSCTATSTSCPGTAGQFEPRIEGDRLYGRGAYDMKGALAAMLVTAAAMRDQDGVRVRLGIVGDEESEEEAERGCDHLVDSGFIGDFAITGEPTDLHIGVEAKGVLALRLRGRRRGRPRRHALARRQRRAQGDRRFPQYRVATVCAAQLGAVRPPLDQPRPDLGGDALNKVPDRCVIDVDIRYLPDQDPAEILGAGAGHAATPRSRRSSPGRRRSVDRDSPYVRALRDAAARSTTTASR